NFLGYRRFRFNYYALKAMKARLYMYLGNKEKANEFAKEVINALDKKGDKMLTLAGAADFTAKNFSLPSECILALSNFEISKNTGDLFSAKPRGLFLTKKHFEKDLFVGQAIAVNNRALKLWDTKADNQGNIKPVIKKYDQPGSDEYTNSNMLAVSKQVIPLIRLSEMYLIAIETAPSLTDANALYDEYMRARNVSATPLTEMSLMEEIIREYRREFFAEGQMFYTYKRLGIAKLLWKTDREVGENDYVAPLPTTEMNVNQK
ncbi:MAG: RagB/SusD family nutrient uptake outer membrane protein, partial [Odoribacter sp.]